MMILARKQNPIEFNCMLNELGNDRVNQYIDLGVIVDSKLTMIPHIDQQINKAKSMLTQNTMKTLYMSLVRSHLDYASV